MKKSPQMYTRLNAWLARRDMMQGNTLNGTRVAILVTNDFEQAELAEPKKALEQAGANVKIITPQAGKVQGMNHDVKADTFPVDLTLDEANPDDFDAVML